MLLNLKFKDFKQGKGLWKVNNSPLKQQEYLDTINKVIKKNKKQYTLFIYSEDSVDEIHDSDIQFTIPKNSRAKTISFASYLKKNNNDKEKNN